MIIICVCMDILVIVTHVRVRHVTPSLPSSNVTIMITTATQRLTHSRENRPSRADIRLSRGILAVGVQRGMREGGHPCVSLTVVLYKLAQVY